VGAVAKLSAVVRNASGAQLQDKPVYWASRDTSIAQVD
jgi:uncharacterized protein YjdB